MSFVLSIIALVLSLVALAVAVYTYTHGYTKSKTLNKRESLTYQVIDKQLCVHIDGEWIPAKYSQIRVGDRIIE